MFSAKTVTWHFSKTEYSSRYNTKQSPLARLPSKMSSCYLRAQDTVLDRIHLELGSVSDHPSIASDERPGVAEVYMLGSTRVDKYWGERESSFPWSDNQVEVVLLWDLSEREYGTDLRIGQVAEASLWGWRERQNSSFWKSGPGCQCSWNKSRIGLGGTK